MTKKERTSPDRTVETLARATGAQVQVMWIMDGPRDTQVACIECLLINKGLVLVETFKGGGWDAFTAPSTNSRDDTVADVLNRCGVPVPAKFKVMVDGDFVTGTYLGKDADDAIERAKSDGHTGKRYSAVQVA